MAAGGGIGPHVDERAALGILSTANTADTKVILHARGPRAGGRHRIPDACAREVAARHGIERVRGIMGGCSRTRRSTVYIPLPNHLHPGGRWPPPWQASTSCEKPLAMTAARPKWSGPRTGRRAAWRRSYRPPSGGCREIVASGRIGRLLAVQSWFSYYNDDPSNIRNIQTSAVARCTTSAATTSTCRGCSSWRA